MFTKWKKWTSLALVAALSIGAPSYAHADDLSAISSSSTDADMNASENTEEAIGESPAQKDEPPVSTEVSSDTASAASPTQAEEKETPSDAPVDDAAAFSQSTQSAAKEEETDVSASSDSSDHSSSESVVADSSNSEEGKEKEIEDKKDDVDLSGLDFTSMRLVIGTNDASLIAGDKSIVGSYDNVYLAQYDSEENAEKAYEKYFGKADFVEPDTGLGAAEESAENTSNTMTEALMTENSNPMQELSSVDSDREDSSDVVALVDTGSSSYTFRSVSMIGDDGVDKNGHGTNTAKWITEEAGKASILSIKALNDAGDGTVSSVYAAIQYAISQRVRVINLSLSGYAMNDSAAIDQAIRDAVSAGILVVGAAGNNGKNTSYFVPGRCADAIILGSCDEDGKRLPSSNDGATVDYYVTSASTSEAAARFTGKLVKASFIAEDAVKTGGVFTKDGESLRNPEEEKGEKEETKDEKTTLSAAADTITITLNANGGTFSDGTTTKQVQCTTWYDRKNFPYPNKSGYISCGWSENASALSDKTNGYNLTNGETLYAVYTPSSGTWNGSTGSWYDPKWSFDVSTGILTVTGGYVYKTIQPWWNFPERITQIKATGTVYLYSDSRSLFRRCENLTSINLANFNTSRVTDMGAMFYGCKNLTSLDLSNFYTSNVTNMSEMFFGCANLNKLDLSKFNTSRVTNMYSMFENCEKLTTLDLSNFNTGNVRDMHRMFNQCHNLTSIKFGSLFKTQNVTTMSSMFRACGKLTSLDVSGFDTRNVTDMSSMFSDVPLTNTSVSNFNTSKVTDMNSMFDGCDFATIDLSHFDTSHVTDMQAMFMNCDKLTSLNLSNFQTSNVKDMSFFVYNCPKLAELNLESFVTSNVTHMEDFFASSGIKKATFGQNFVIPSFYNYNFFPTLYETYSGQLTTNKWGLGSENAATSYSGNDFIKLGQTNGKLTGTWYAQAAKKYTLTYNGNGGTPSTTSTTGYETKTWGAWSSLAYATRTGYYFQGWYTAASGGTQVTSSTPCTTSLTVYAHWKAKSYTISFDANGGSGTTASVSATYDSNMPSITIGLSRSGYTFTGFYDAATGGTKYYNADGSSARTWNKAANTTLYAQWTLTPYKFDVNPMAHVTGFRLKKNKADADNGTTIGDYYADAHMGDKFYLYSPTFATGYEFNGFTNQYGPGTQSISGSTATITMGAGAQAIAINAKATTYSISYNVNGGSLSGQKTSYTIESAAFTLPAPTRAGYTFAGWTGSNGSTPQTSVTIQTGSTGNKTYTANWTVNQYTVTCEDWFVDASNNRRVKLGSATKLYNYGTTASGADFGSSTSMYEYYTYYQYNGCSTATVGTSGATVYRYFYAWTDLNIYYANGENQGGATVSFKVGNGNWNDVTNESNTIQPYGTTYYIRNIRPIHAYESFNGSVANITYDSTNQWYTCTPTKAGIGMDLYMSYTSYSIGYTLNGGIVSGNPTSYNYTTAAITLKNPTRTGYTFAGWTESNGTTAQTSVMIPQGSSGNKSYTANWNANHTTVTLDMQGGKTSNTGSDATVAADKSTEKFTTTYDSGNYYFRSVPSRTGYTFQGYYTQPNGNGIKVYGADAQAVGDGTYFTAAKLWHYTGSSITFYAYWTINTYTNHIAHWTWGYKNKEGNNGGKDAFQIGSSDISEPYGAKYTLNASNGMKIPNGFYLENTFGTSSISNFWNHYAFGTEITQNADVMSFEYDYYPNDYTITYELNGGTNNSANPSSYNVLYGVTLASPTRSGYTFTGWTMDGKTVTGINPGANASFTSADDLYSKLASRTTGNKKVIANWKANSYTVAFNGNGATYGSTASESMTYDTAKTLTPNGYSRAGYRFAGWNTKADGSGTSFTNESSVKNLATNGTVTLYAKWQAENNTITYSAQTGGNVSRSSETISGTSAAQGSTATAKTGYTFDGWYAADQKVGASASYIPDSPYSANKNSLVGNYYGGAVTYDASNDIYNVTASKNSANSNWGSGASGNTSAVIPYGKSFTVSFDIYSPIATAVQIDINNYAQTGSSWNGNDNDGSRWGGTSTSLKANTWTRITYSWTNDSAGNTNKVAMIDRSGIGLIMTGATSDITFKIRNYEAVVSTGLLHDASSFTARFTANKYNIAFQANGGSGTMANETMIYDTAKTLTANSFVRTGYTFVGWNTKADGSGTSYTNGATVKNLATGGTVTLYAKWTPNIGVLTYNANGGMIGTTSKTGWSISKDGTILLDGKINHSLNGQVDDGIIVYGSKYDLINTDNQSWLNLSRTGYHIKPGAQWNTRADGTGTSFEQDTEYTAQQFIPALETTNNATATVYAKWVPNAYDIVFDANTGTGTMSNESMTYDTAKTLTANSFVRTGYTFAGWNTKADGSGTKYADKESVKNLAESGTVILYAQWTANTYTVTIPTAISYTNMPTGKVDVNTSFDISVECKTGSFTDTIEVSSAATQMASKGGGNSLTAASKSSQTPLSFTSAGTKQDQVAITGIANTADVWTGAVQYTVTKK
ncbi:InlB B-repeat-containing protein [Bilifractor sp. HCP3S3_D3]|uniref:InlB B-repeat-containing protein n=1 Tax=Bilifractor sp. HCP3S3_D3 TaxID=3438907 RepID=UPI003F88AEBB